jgi:hypothetical protein
MLFDLGICEAHQRLASHHSRVSPRFGLAASPVNTIAEIFLVNRFGQVLSQCFTLALYCFGNGWLFSSGPHLIVPRLFRISFETTARCPLSRNNCWTLSSSRVRGTMPHKSELPLECGCPASCTGFNMNRTKRAGDMHPRCSRVVRNHKPTYGRDTYTSVGATTWQTNQTSSAAGSRRRLCQQIGSGQLLSSSCSRSTGKPTTLLYEPEISSTIKSPCSWMA